VTDMGPQQLLDEARRLLIRQEADLDTLRVRAVTMLTVAAVLAGLFAPRISTHDHWRAALVALSLVMFAATAGLVVFIQWPRAMYFHHDLTSWIEEWAAGTEPVHSELAYNWSRDFIKSRKDNAEIINRLQWCFTLACALVGMQVLTWGAATF
jgi:hypothetical protein